MSGAGPAAEPLVSVVVPAHDAQDRLRGLLAALRGQTLPAERFEVLIVDDCSADGTPAVVRGDGFARLIRTEKRAGAYACRNRAIAEAKGDVVAFTDSDCEPQTDWLERLLEELQDSSTGMLGGRIRVPPPTPRSLAELVDAAHHLDQESFIANGYAAFANFACRRSVLDRVGALNDRLISNGDREFCLRAVSAGFSLGYAPRAVVVHPPLSHAREVARRAFRMGVGRAQTAVHGRGPAHDRRHNWLPLRAYVPWGLIGGEVFGERRLRQDGWRLSRGERLRMEAAGYLLVGLPVMSGYLLGAIEGRLPRRLAQSS